MLDPFSEKVPNLMFCRLHSDCVKKGVTLTQTEAIEIGFKPDSTTFCMTRTNCLTSLCLSFPICNMGMIKVPALQDIVRGLKDY